MKNRRKRVNCMNNQKGFTLVELLVGMAILSIVAAAITGFIVTSSKSYAAANTEIVVQQEAQLAMNQISDVVIDTTRSVNYVGYAADGSVSQQVVKDAEFTIDVKDKSLTLFNGVETEKFDEHGMLVLDAEGNPVTEISGGSGNQFNYQFYYDKDREILYFSQIALSEADFPESDRVVLAEYVKDFSADLSQIEEKRVIQLTVTYEYNNRVFETSNNITIRNKVLVNSVNLAVNRTVELSVIPRENMVVLEPGEDYYKFSSPRIEGRNITDKSVTWSIPAEEQSKLTGADTGFMSPDDAKIGKIHISSAEKAISFKVRITTNAVDSSGNHATADVVVYVKRANEVTLSKSADSDAKNGALEISPGCTFTISANVSGPKLGVTCSKCSDDVTIDGQVGHTGTPFPWLIHDPSAVPGATTSWNPNKYIKMIESAADHATFYFGPDENGNMPTSDELTDYTVVIQAASLLSVTGNAYGRNYDPAFGAIELKMVKHKEANISMGGSIHWGASTEVTWKDLPSYHYYVVCARVREYDTEGGDKIMMYLSEGTTTRVTPDMFGVEDVSKQWYLSLQVLVPDTTLPAGVGLSENLNVGAQVNDQAVLDMIDDYIHNCDSSGTYVGTKYRCSDKLEATINPPEIYYEYNGEKNLGGELKLKPVSILGGLPWTEFKVDYVRNTRDEVLGYWFANNNIKYSVYKEKDNGELERIYWYNSDGNNYEGESSPYGGFLQLSEINATGAKIKLDSNSMGRASEAVGKYLLVPTIIYKQDWSADHAGGNFLYYLNYKPNYNKNQYYEDKRSTVYYELTGGNLKDLWTNSYGKFYKGEIYFPVPSDSEFGKFFELKDTSEQSYSGYNYFRLKDKDGNIQGIEFSRMTCKYISTEDAYEIELFYKYHDEFWGRDFKISAGRFSCKSNGTEWTKVHVGDFDELLDNGKEIILNGSMRQIWLKTQNNGFIQGEIYFPTPSDDSFNTLFGSLTGQESKTVSLNDNNGKFKVRGTDGNGHGEVSFTKAVGKLNADGSYAVELFYNYHDDFWNKDIEISAGTYTCTADGNRWTKTGSGTFDEKLAKGEEIILDGTMSQIWLKTQNNGFKQGEIYLPTPSDDSFNTLFGSLTSQESKTVSLNNRNFKVRGTDGNDYGEVSFTKAVGKLNADGSYAVELFYKYHDDFWGKDIEISAGTYACAANGNKWTKTGSGTFDEKLAKGETVRYEGNATITKDGKTYNAYIPFPIEASFTNNWEFGFDLDAFKNGTKVEQESKNVITIQYKNDENGEPKKEDICCSAGGVRCTYDKATETYTLKMEFVDNPYYQPNKIGEVTLTYKEGDTCWVVTK